MDLNQQKLSKREWDTTEIPVSQEEKEILTLIIKGYHDVNIMYNKNMTMINFMKLEPNENIKDYLYTEYFEKAIYKLVHKYEVEFDSSLPNNLKRVSSMEKLKCYRIIRTQEYKSTRLRRYNITRVETDRLQDETVFSQKEYDTKRLQYNKTASLKY